MKFGIPVSVFLGLSLCCVTASADNEVTLVQSRSEVDKVCAMGNPGILCVKPGDEAQSARLKYFAPLEISQTQLIGWDRFRRSPPRLWGFLILHESHAPLGEPYYTASAKVFKEGMSGTINEDTDYLSILWSEVDRRFAVAAENSEQAQAFTASLDRQTKERTAAADAKHQTDLKKQADEQYRASPEYAAAERQRRVSQCEATISQAKHAIAQDDRVAHISGYENKMVREQAAIAIVQCQDFLANQ